MKILIVIPSFPVNVEDTKGGVASALSNLLKGFEISDISVRVVSFNREVSQTIIVNYSHNITIYYTAESKLPHVINFIFKGSATIKNHIREFDPVIIHYVMSGYILLTKFFGLLHKIPMVTIHGIPFAEARQKEKIKDKLVWYSNGIVEFLLCPSNIIHLSNYSAKLHGNNNKSIVAIIPNAINPSYFDLPLKTTTNNRILYIGSIDTNKNIMFLLKALKALVENKFYFTLAVLGGFVEDNYKEEVLSYIKDNQLEKNVTFYGWVPQQKLKSILSESDILMVSSKQESLPMVIAEAMSAGKVVVSSITGGTSEMITNGVDGFLYNISAIENVLPILEKLYDNDKLVCQIQGKAKQKAMATYHCNMVAQKTIAFYKSVLK